MAEGIAAAAGGLGGTGGAVPVCGECGVSGVPALVGYLPRFWDTCAAHHTGHESVLLQLYYVLCA